MKQNHDFILKELSGIKYILPYGQQIADRQPGIQVNETGEYIWNLLKNDLTIDEILNELQEYYSIGEDEFPEFSCDIKNFLMQLISMEIIYDENYSQKINESYFSSVNIAGILIDLYGKNEVFSDDFHNFFCTVTDNATADLKIVVTSNHFFRPYPNAGGTLLIHTEELLVTEREKDYYLLFPSSKNIEEASIDKEGRFAYVKYYSNYDNSLADDVFHTIRFLFLYKASTRGLLALHSASILYRDKAWLFSGHSGKGKSTHTNLWNRLLSTPVINGDLNLIDCNSETPMVYGIPWCGTSQISDTKSYVLGGIILLDKAPENRIDTLPSDKKTLLVTQRIISPSWTEDLFLKNLRLIENLSDKIIVLHYPCTKDDSAVFTIKDYIDGELG